MHGASAALAAIGRANMALCEQCLGISLRTFARAYRLNVAAFEAFCARPFAAAQAAVMGSSAGAQSVSSVDVVEHWARTGEICGALFVGLPGLVAEYAADMSAIE